jgi:5-methylcytosine-specific restriction endonuclease McrA
MPGSSDSEFVSTKGAHSNNGGKGRTKRQKRLLLFRQQSGLCAICGEHMGLQNKHGDRAATLDHILPRSKGGTFRMTNLRAVHRVCNRERGNTTGDLFIEAAGIIALRWDIKELP